MNKIKSKNKIVLYFSTFIGFMFLIVYSIGNIYFPNVMIDSFGTTFSETKTLFIVLWIILSIIMFLSTRHIIGDLE